jgi:hypothetical protein
LKKLRFEDVDDEEKLNEASEDCVRAEFKALVRGLEIADEDVVPPPARNAACLVLDEGSVAMLANLEFSEGFEDDFKKFKGEDLESGGCSVEETAGV